MQTPGFPGREKVEFDAALFGDSFENTTRTSLCPRRRAVRLTSGDDVFLRGGQCRDEGDQAAVLHLSNQLQGTRLASVGLFTPESVMAVASHRGAATVSAVGISIPRSGEDTTPPPPMLA